MAFLCALLCLPCEMHAVPFDARNRWISAKHGLMNGSSSLVIFFQFGICHSMRVNVLHSVIFVMEFFGFGFVASVLFLFCFVTIWRLRLISGTRPFRYCGQNHTRSMPRWRSKLEEKKKHILIDAILNVELGERWLIEWIIRQKCSGGRLCVPEHQHCFARTAYRNAMIWKGKWVVVA